VEVEERDSVNLFGGCPMPNAGKPGYRCACKESLSLSISGDYCRDKSRARNQVSHLCCDGSRRQPFQTKPVPDHNDSAK
jgi:hypothetical protein